MQEQIEKLESLQAELRERTNVEDYIVWKGSTPTKILVTQLLIDLEDIKENWIQGQFQEEGKEAAARAQASYIVGLLNGINDEGEVE